MERLSKKISVDAETYAAVHGYMEERACGGWEGGIGNAACELIAEGLRSKRAGIWDVPFARAVRNAMREVAEADRMDRAEELSSAMLDLEGRAIEVKAAAIAVLLAQGYDAGEAMGLYAEALAICSGGHGDDAGERAWT